MSKAGYIAGGVATVLIVCSSLYFGSALNNFSDAIRQYNKNKHGAVAGSTHNSKSTKSKKSSAQSEQKDNPQSTTQSEQKSPQSVDPVSFALGRQTGALEERVQNQNAQIKDLKEYQNAINNNIYTQSFSRTSFFIGSNGFAFSAMNGNCLGYAGIGYGTGWIRPEILPREMVIAFDPAVYHSGWPTRPIGTFQNH